MLFQLSYTPNKYGAENESRTRGLNHGKVALYQLSYFRECMVHRVGVEPTRLSTQRPQRCAATHYAICARAYMVGTDGFEPPRLSEPGLQPGAIGHSATSPSFICSGGWARTSDTRINSPLLYRLSYTGANKTQKKLEHGARFELAWTFVGGFAIRCLQPLGHPCRNLRSTRSGWSCSPVSSQRPRAVFETLAIELGFGLNPRHRARVVWWGRMDSNHRVFWSLVYSQVQSASLPHPRVRALGNDLVRVCWNSRQQSLIEKNVPGPLQGLSSRGEQTGSPPGHQVWKHAVVVRIPSHANPLHNHDQASCTL